MTKIRRGAITGYPLVTSTPVGETPGKGSKETLALIEEQLNKKEEPSPTPSGMTDAMKKFVQKGGGHPVAINEKKSNKEYASMPLAVNRNSLAEIAELLTNIPLRGGRKKPGFSVKDYIRLAIDQQIKRDKKNVKKFLSNVSKAISYTVDSGPKSST